MKQNICVNLIPFKRYAINHYVILKLDRIGLDFQICVYDKTHKHLSNSAIDRFHLITSSFSNIY